MTFREFITDLRRNTHPAGLPANLEPAYDRLVIDGLIYAQKYVQCLREKHTDIYEFCSTYLYCYMSVMSAPNGRITRVFSVDADSFCDPVTYRQMSYDEVKCEAQKLTFDRGLIPYAGYAQLPEPFAYAHYAGDGISDRTCGRSRYGFYAIHNGRLHTAPYLHSEERLVVEWEGLKRNYTDTDVVNDDPELFRAVKLFVTKEIALHYERDELIYAGATREFMEAMADLHHECQEQIRIREAHLCDTSGIGGVCGTCGAGTN